MVYNRPNARSYWSCKSLACWRVRALSSLDMVARALLKAFNSLRKRDTSLRCSAICSLVKSSSVILEECMKFLFGHCLSIELPTVAIIDDGIFAFDPFRAAHEEMVLRPSLLGHEGIKPFMCSFDAGLLLTVSLLLGLGVMLFHNCLAESNSACAYTVI